MARSLVVPRALAAALSLAPLAAVAASDEDLAQIRNEIRQLKEAYEARIRALEDRLKDAEAKAARAPAPAPAAAATVDAGPATTAVPRASGIAAFNPAISAVLQGRYADLSQDPDAYRISGFPPGGEIGPGPRGLSLAESEITMSASVDHLFAAQLTLALSPENEVSVEEAYGVVTAAPFGIVPKFGRFFSGLGYQNEQHQHAWDFIDAPLAYEAFLGGQYANDGLQLKWVAPTDQFLEFGAELGNGDSFPGNPRNKNGIGSFVAYAHTGGDVGASHSWRAGLSYLSTRAQDREYTQPDALGNEALLGFSGSSDTAIADFVWKWAPNGNARETNFKVQGEYFWRRERGELTYDKDGALGLTQTDAYRATQQGFYVQGVWQFMPHWRVGARYDRLDPGSIDYGANAALLETPSFKPRRYSVMLDYSPSEFSRFRLQYSQSKVQADVTDDQIFLQYILTLGAHGGHKF
jgi:hypothetical protein